MRLIPSAMAGAFAERYAVLSDESLRTHFAGFRGVRAPQPPAPTASQLRNARRVLDGEFLLVGEAYRLPPGFSWQRNPSADKEWQIAHHKFYFAPDLIQAWRATKDARYLKCWVALLGSWLDEMGSGFIGASDAQVEAKRVEHWVASFLLLQGSAWESEVPAAFVRRFLERIADETWYICQNLRPSRNHRTFQLYSIFLVGVLFPEFRGHEYFRDSARTRLTANLLTDFGRDGVHVELSTHYHQITLETALAFVELAQLNGVALAAPLLARLHRALEFSLHIAWPDGSMPLINDSDDGDHLPMLRLGARLFDDPSLLWAASRGRDGEPPQVLSRHFEDCGYFTLSDTWGCDAPSYAARQHVFYDCAKLGEGSHSHYDLLNFCWYAGGSPLVVDPGRYTYNADPDATGIDWRREFKSTRCHNTVTIDGLDQTRYLSKSKCPPPGVERFERGRHAAKHGPDAEVVEVQHGLGAVSDWVWAGVLSREYAPVHTRLLVFMAAQYLFIFDHVRIMDKQPHECVLRFHLDARWQGRVALEEGADEAILRAPGWQIRSLREPGLGATLGSGWVSRQYGVKQTAPVLSLARRGERSLFFATVLAHDAGAPQGLSIARLRRLSADAAPAATFQVEGSAGGRGFTDRFVVRPEVADEEYGDEWLRYRGRFLAYRCDATGGFSFLCAARPQRLELTRRAGAKRSFGGHVEWLAWADGALRSRARTAGGVPS